MLKPCRIALYVRSHERPQGRVVRQDSLSRAALCSGEARDPGARSQVQDLSPHYQMAILAEKRGQVLALYVERGSARSAQLSYLL